MPEADIVRKMERAAFKHGNRFLMVPLLRAGLARFMGSPPTGYFLLLRTTGRKSGKPRYTPVNYAIEDGCVYCMAGFGERAHWLANLRQDPRVQVRLPDRTLEGLATEITDRTEASRLAAKVARNSGFALIFEDARCLLMSDEQLARQLEGRPVVRIRPLDGPVVPGPYDPGGRGWVLAMLAQGMALAGIMAWLRHRQTARR